MKFSAPFWRLETFIINGKTKVLLSLQMTHDQPIILTVE